MKANLAAKWSRLWSFVAGLTDNKNYLVNNGSIVEARLGVKVELLWSGSVGSAGIALTLSSPIVAGDQLLVVHTDANADVRGCWPVLAEKMVAGQNWAVAPGLNTIVTYNSPTQITTVAYTNGYGIAKIYRVRVG